jgi:hypothetical protein
MCRQKAAQVRQSAAKAKNPSMRRAFEEVASGWLLLADQTEWIEQQSSQPPDEAASN